MAFHRSEDRDRLKEDTANVFKPAGELLEEAGSLGGKIPGVGGLVEKTFDDIGGKFKSGDLGKVGEGIFETAFLSTGVPFARRALENALDETKVAGDTGEIDRLRSQLAPEQAAALAAIEKRLKENKAKEENLRGELGLQRAERERLLGEELERQLGTISLAGGEAREDIGEAAASRGISRSSFNQRQLERQRLNEQQQLGTARTGAAIGTEQAREAERRVNQQIDERRERIQQQIEFCLGNLLLYLKTLFEESNFKFVISLLSFIYKFPFLTFICELASANKII